MRINFQTMYTEIKNNLTFDNKENIKILKSKIEEKTKIKINDEFMMNFEFFILLDNEYKNFTYKQILQKFFSVYQSYFEEHHTIETTRYKEECIINELIKDLTFKKHVSFKLRNRKIVFHIYNREDKDKVKKINSNNLALNKIEFFVYDVNNKLKRIDIIKELIKDNLKDYII